MPKITFSVRPDLHNWNGYASSGNPHTVDADSKLAKEISAAYSAGALVGVEGKLPPVQSDQDSLKAQEKAMKSGVWQEGNALAYLARKEEDE